MLKFAKRGQNGKDLLSTLIFLSSNGFFLGMIYSDALLPAREAIKVSLPCTLKNFDALLEFCTLFDRSDKFIHSETVLWLAVIVAVQSSAFYFPMHSDEERWFIYEPIRAI